jgi:transcriptional regulator with XRE-family HTH domain
MPGTIIRRFREMHNYSQKYVASKMGISQNAYSKIENNITQLTIEHLKKLSVILDVSVMDLLKDDFEIHKPLHVNDRVITLLVHLRKSMEGKKKSKHPLYPVIMSLLKTTEEIANNVD